jgi:hypothetical protein
MAEAVVSSDEPPDSWLTAWSAVASAGGSGGGGAAGLVPTRLLLEAASRALLEEGGSGLSGGMKVLYILASIALVVVSGLMVRGWVPGARRHHCHRQHPGCPMGRLPAQRCCPACPFPCRPAWCWASYPWTGEAPRAGGQVVVGGALCCWLALPRHRRSRWNVCPRRPCPPPPFSPAGWTWRCCVAPAAIARSGW